MPSSVIRTWSYDAPTRRLDVTFVSGLRYRYADVPPEVAHGLGSAPSQGRYFNERIRDGYAFARVRRNERPHRRLSQRSANGG